ncbi:MAG: type II secretion system protein, partial [Bacilli bacterium]
MTKNINGFTLIEIMGILVLLSIISMITMTIVTDSVRNSKKTITETQQINIKKAANDWALNNSDNLPIKENESINITLGALKQNGYIDAYIKD